MPENRASGPVHPSGQADASWRPEADVRGLNLSLIRAVLALRGRAGRTLEVGAGTARFLRALRRRLPEMEGYACDLESEPLAQARSLDAGLHVARGDLTALPYQDASFDTVLVFDVFEHLYKPEEGIREVWRVLKPGGVLHSLVPCEGQPLTLHWLMWKTHIAADLKEKRVGHVQRFTHDSITALLQGEGFDVQHVRYSMHPIGQVKDIMLHWEQGPEVASWLTRNPLYRAVSIALWGGSYLESTVLGRVPLSAVALHITAIKPCQRS